MTQKDKKALLDFLNSQRLMTLATCNKKAWVCTVYYVTDKDLNLYFVSPPDSKHIGDIEKNNKVACAIADSHTLNSQKKVGIQLQGIASQVKGWEKTKTMLKVWHKVNPGAEKINVKNMQAGIVSSRVYKIKPTLIKFFNQKLYKEARINKF